MWNIRNNRKTLYINVQENIKIFSPIVIVFFALIIFRIIKPTWLIRTGSHCNVPLSTYIECAISEATSICLIQKFQENRRKSGQSPTNSNVAPYTLILTVFPLRGEINRNMSSQFYYFLGDLCCGVTRVTRVKYQAVSCFVKLRPIHPTDQLKWINCEL